MFDYPFRGCNLFRRIYVQYNTHGSSTVSHTVRTNGGAGFRWDRRVTCVRSVLWDKRIDGRTVRLEYVSVWLVHW